MNKITNVTYTFDKALDIDSICEMNSSFDKGVLRIAYHGKNRNGTNISKNAFEAAIPSLANVPVVTHYMRQRDELGGHDMELVTGNDGQDYLIYATDPVGVVPSSPNCWWEEIEDAGVMHEYLCTDVLLWKRQEAYKNIKESGIVGQSMEITVNSGEQVDGVYNIHSFIFTALCLLGDKYEPCFESASLNVFGLSDFQTQYQAMLNDFKLEFATASGTNPTQEGGNEPMNNEPNVYVEEPDVTVVENPEIDSVYVEEETEVVISSGEVEGNDDDFNGDSIDGSGDNCDETSVVVENAEPATTADFSLTVMAQLDELSRMVRDAEIIMDSCGYEYSRYIMVDVQADEVIVYDSKDNWNLYGARITETGDKLSIDFENMKRKKVSYEDFLETDVSNNWMYEAFSGLYCAVNEATNAKNEAVAKFDELNAKYEVLYAAEQTRLAAEHAAAVEEVFARFEKLLAGDAEFEALRSMEHEDVQALENTCFSLYGKKTAVFSTNNKKKSTVSVAVGANENKGVQKLPYGDLMAFLNKEV